MKKAEITAFLSLTFVLLVSFVLGILEISVLHTSKNMSRLAADRAVFSVFGEYQKKLLNDYHVFAVDGSYGTGDYTEERVLGRMRCYGTEGMEHEVTGIQFLTDMKGQAFREQVLEYMESKYGVSLIRDLTGMIPKWEEEKIQGENMEEKESTILDEYEELKSSAPDPSVEEAGEAASGTGEETEGTGEQTSDTEMKGSPFGCLEQIEKSGLLSVVMPKEMELSGLEIELDNQASVRSLNQGRGTFPVRQSTDGAEEKLLFNEYVMERFRNAVTETKEETADTGKTEDAGNRSLAYETEYIIAGKSSDKENLEAVLFRIFLIRMAMNYAYLLTDTQKQSQAGTLATTISALLLIPQASEILKQLVLLAWAAGESVVDLRTLLSGKKTALVKNADNWQLPLSSLLTLGSGSENTPGEDAENGITYEEYLRAFLFLENSEEVTMRTIDRAEENMKTEHGLEFFRADQCFTKIEIKNQVELFGGLTYTFPVYFGYL